MSNCASLASGITLNCSTIITSGAEEEIVLFNYDDIDRDSSTITGTQISVLALAGSPAPLGYLLEGTNNSVRPAYTQTKESQGNPFKFTHNIPFRIFNKTAAINDILQDLAGGLFTAFVFTRNQLVEVYGFRVGLEAVINQDAYENDGLIIVTLQTPADQFETKVPLIYTGAASPVASFDTLKAEIIALT